MEFYFVERMSLLLADDCFQEDLVILLLKVYRILKIHLHWVNQTSICRHEAVLRNAECGRKMAERETC